MKLTKPQLKELRLLAVERQSTRGCNRARVQNSLREKKLARFCEEDGSRREVSIYEVLASYGNPHPFCEITDAGREVLRELDKPRAARVRAAEQLEKGPL